MATTEDLSKLNSYAVLIENGPDASKVVSYAVLFETGPDASKLVSYAVLITNDLEEHATASDSINATVTNAANISESASAADSIDATSTGNTRGLSESATATDTIVGIYFGIIDPGPVEVANAVDAIDASFHGPGSVGLVRATQVVMQVLTDVPQNLKPWVWVNWC